MYHMYHLECEMYLQMSLYRNKVNVSNIYINEKIEMITYHET